MEQIWGWIKENITAFWAGFFSGGVPVAINLLHVPSMLGVVGDILKGSTVLIFSTCSGLLLVAATDLYKHYLKNRMIRLIDKAHTLLMSKLFKNGKSRQKQRRQKNDDKAA
jgi:hypothetical protein